VDVSLYHTHTFRKRKEKESQVTRRHMKNLEPKILTQGIVSQVEYPATSTMKFRPNAVQT
jgi:hypothetical protein